MIESIAVQTAAGAILSLPLVDIDHGYLVLDVEGLDPVRAVMVTSSFATLDGTQFQSARREERNIRLRVGIEPDYEADETVRSLRNQLYTYLMPKSEVTLSFVMEDGDTYKIVGRVESHESPLFTKDPESVISLMCFDPDFREPTPDLIPGLGTVSDTTEVEIEYEGTVETGIVLTMSVDRALSEFTIYHRAPDGKIVSFDFAEDLVAGDILTVSTVVGDKYVTLTRGSTVSSLLNGMSPQSSWIELENGTNYLRVYALGASIPYTVSYYTRYGGL